MAVATESHGQIQEFLDVLRKRRWQIALPALYVLTVGIALAVVVPKKYEITTEVEIRESRVETDYQLRDPDESATKQELQNARQHIQHFRRIRSIIEEQPDLWKDYFALDATERGDYVRRVMGNLKVEVAEKKKDYGSTFITVTYTDVDGARGTKFLTRLSDLWIHEVIDQDRQKLEKERDILQDQEARVRKEYNRLNQQYIDLAKQMDIDPTRPLGLANPVDKGADPYYTKYYELVSSGQDVDSDLARAEGALETMRAQLESEPLEIQTEAKEGGTKFATEIQQLSSEILFAETQRSGLTPLHSRHVRLGDHIKELQAKIDNYRALESEGGVRIVWQPNPRRQKLIEDIAVKEIEVQGLRTQLGYLRSEVVKQSALLDARAEDYRDLQDLNDERATSKLELNIVHTELGQKMRAIEVVNKAWGDPYDIVEPPTSTAEPVEPNPLLIVTFAALAGLALGLFVAVVGEYAPNSYRNVHEITRVLGIPVLGAIGSIVTRREARLVRAKRAFVGICSMVSLAGLGWFIWLCAYSEETLPTGVRQAIYDFQLMLM